MSVTPQGTCTECKQVFFATPGYFHTFGNKCHKCIGLDIKPGEAFAICGKCDAVIREELDFYRQFDDVPANEVRCKECLSAWPLKE